MKHKFIPSATDPTKCAELIRDSVCSRSEIDHTDRATCEVCGSSGNCDFYCYDTEYLMCVTCLDKERNAAIARGGIHLEQLKEKMNTDELIALSKKIDNSIQVREDIFNAKTVAIHELKVKIDSDTSISEADKHITLARIIEQRFNHLSEVVIKDARETINAALNEQRAIQTYWQELAKKLRAEEREQIKLKDINYKPLPPPKAVKSPSVKKYDKNALRLLLMEHKKQVPNTRITEEILTITCMSRNMNPADALQMLVPLMNKDLIVDKVS